MSKRSHHRHSNINVNELADALTRMGWQPPQRGGVFPPFRNGGANLPPANYGGSGPMNNLAALSGMIGGGPAGESASFPPQINGNGNETMMPMQMPMLPQIPSHRPRSAAPANDKELLRKLLEEILAILKEK